MTSRSDQSIVVLETRERSSLISIQQQQQQRQRREIDGCTILLLADDRRANESGREKNRQLAESPPSLFFFFCHSSFLLFVLLVAVFPSLSLLSPPFPFPSPMPDFFSFEFSRQDARHQRLHVSSTLPTDLFVFTAHMNSLVVVVDCRWRHRRM